MSAVIWIMGLSGSGKTTTAEYVTTKLRENGEVVIHLDGDELRVALNQLDNYNQSDRETLSLSYARLSQLISIQGPTVVVSSIGLYAIVQNWLRENIDCYIEVFLEASMELLISRDSRGIYSRNTSNSGPVVGKDFAPQFPSSPDLLLKVDNSLTVAQCGDAVIESYLSVLRSRTGLNNF